MTRCGFSTSPCLSRWTVVDSGIARPAYLLRSGEDLNVAAPVGDRLAEPGDPFLRGADVHLVQGAALGHGQGQRIGLAHHGPVELKQLIEPGLAYPVPTPVLAEQRKPAHRHRYVIDGTAEPLGPPQRLHHPRRRARAR